MIRALFNGLLGASALTLGAEVLKRTVDDAPRLDRLGMDGAQALLKNTGLDLSDKQLFAVSLVGDIAMNALYFSQVGERSGFGTLLKGLSLGLTMGGGTVNLTDKIGLNGNHVKRSPKTALYTVGLYTLGGLTAALVAQAFAKRK